MTLLVIATLMMTITVPVTTGLVSPAQVSPSGSEAPALAGITPPVGTMLANMDIIVKARPRGEPAIYELKSPQSATAFRDQYALNAKRAGYRVVTRNQLVVGVRQDGTSIRLRVIEADHGSAAVLTIKPPANDRT